MAESDLHELEVTPERTEHDLTADSAQVIDVREDYERDAGHVAGMRHIALDRLAAEASTLDPARPVILVCRAGSRSLMAAQALRHAGFDAYSMAGGLLRWTDEQRPLDGHVATH